jgi:hypothetical protein
LRALSFRLLPPPLQSCHKLRLLRDSQSESDCQRTQNKWRLARVCPSANADLCNKRWTYAVVARQSRRFVRIENADSPLHLT